MGIEIILVSLFSIHLIQNDLLASNIERISTHFSLEKEILVPVYLVAKLWPRILFMIVAAGIFTKQRKHLYCTLNESISLN